MRVFQEGGESTDAVFQRQITERDRGCRHRFGAFIASRRMTRDTADRMEKFPSALCRRRIDGLTFEGFVGNRHQIKCDGCGGFFAEFAGKMCHHVWHAGSWFDVQRVGDETSNVSRIDSRGGRRERRTLLLRNPVRVVAVTVDAAKSIQQDQPVNSVLDRSAIDFVVGTGVCDRRPRVGNLHHVFHEVKKLLPVGQLISQLFGHGRHGILLDSFDVFFCDFDQSICSGQVTYNDLVGRLSDEPSGDDASFVGQELCRFETFANFLGRSQDRLDKVFVFLAGTHTSQIGAE